MLLVYVVIILLLDIKVEIFICISYFIIIIIYRFNLQNGQYRGSLPIGFKKGYLISKTAGSVPDRPAGKGKHTKDVTSICFDNLNQV